MELLESGESLLLVPLKSLKELRGVLKEDDKSLRRVFREPKGSSRLKESFVLGTGVMTLHSRSIVHAALKVTPTNNPVLLLSTPC